MRPWQRVALAMFAVGWGANQFSPLLIAYRDELGMSTQTRAFLFGVYAAGLIPSLLLGGGASDRWGRRAVVLPVVALSPVASLVLIAGHESVAVPDRGPAARGVLLGCLLQRRQCLVADLSADEAEGAGARRAAIALSAGFGLGPMLAGLIGEVTAYPLTVPYVPHVVLGVVATVLLLPVRDVAAVGARAAAAAPQHPVGDPDPAVPDAGRPGRALGLRVRRTVDRLPPR